jgi:AhpD family alkylhydroperoxidase
MSDVRVRYEDFAKRMPAVHAALLTLSKSAGQAGLDKTLIELIEIRASQINGCAFCLAYHLNSARQVPVPAAKLDLVATWREAGIFSAREQAALAWTETMTRLGPESASDADYAALRTEFSEDEAAIYLTVTIGVINHWNRLGVALRFPPTLEAPPAAA